MLFGLSWSITDSAVLIVYILLLIFLSVKIGLKNFRNKDSINLFILLLALWRVITCWIKGVVSINILSKNVKFLFDVSPIFVFRYAKVEHQFGYLFYSFILSLSLITALSILEFLGVVDLGFFQGGYLQAFHRNHIKSGFIWSLASLLSLVFTIKMNKKFIIFVPLLVTGLLFTQSRSYYLGFLGTAFIILILVGFKRSFKYSMFAISSIIFTFGLIYLIPEVRSRFLSIFTNIQAEWSIKCRLIFLEEGLKIVEKHPVFGIGFGQWPSYFSQINQIYKYPCPNYHVHNIFIHELVETGLIGLILLILILVIIVYKLLNAYFQLDIKNKFGEALILSGIAAIFNLIIGGLFEPDLVKSVVLIPTFTVLGFALAEADKLTRVATYRS
ncbi:O-Antigen Polymerase family protein [Sulfurihydrogenibium azorense Az-Fu1]|uniref:O-Antigen Polymerase family protein n=1 Tax=Sulfurihydrogenibium azorense (strain DSM 15241 / OCM 825 / Az-Fu1) TaxID=204536 RepID=C1DVB9_SULAA|nr:O-Antigen Polymerase family protein [Sulfurihydrogenibium azorense Az-Fu1]